MQTSLSLLRYSIRHLGSGLPSQEAQLIASLSTALPKIWEDWSQEKKENQKRSELHEILLTHRDVLVEELELVMQEEHPAMSPAGRELLLRYMVQVLSMVHRVLRRAQAGDESMAVASLRLRSADALLMFFPLAFARYQERQQPFDGISLVLDELVEVNPEYETWRAHNSMFPERPRVLLKFFTDSLVASFLRAESEYFTNISQLPLPPSIAPIEHLFFNNQPLCLGYTAFEGTELSGLINEWHRVGPRPSLPHIAQLVADIAQSLGYLHLCNPPQSYGNLKASNVLLAVSEAGTLQICLSDLGLGNLSNMLATRSQVTTTPAFQRATLLGANTRLYCAPQILRGEKPEWRDDIYALGVLWYQMVTGDSQSGRPSGDRWKERLLEVGMTPPMLALLVSCLEEERGKRPNNGMLLAEQIVKLLGEEQALTVHSGLLPIAKVNEEAWSGFDGQTMQGLKVVETNPLQNAELRKQVQEELDQWALDYTLSRLPKVGFFQRWFGSFGAATRRKMQARDVFRQAEQRKHEENGIAAALDLYQEALVLSEEPVLCYYIAQCCRVLGMHLEAVAAYVDFLQAFPDLPSLHLQRIQLFVDKLQDPTFRLADLRKRGMRFFRTPSGLVSDVETGLMWAPSDSGDEFVWPDAEAVCRSYNGGGQSDWRMPTVAELEGLFRGGIREDKGKGGHVISIRRGVWAFDYLGSEAAYFHFGYGRVSWLPQDRTFAVLPVRQAREEELLFL